MAPDRNSPDDVRPVGSWALLLQVFLTGCWLLLAVGAGFLRGGYGRPRPHDQPAPWKLVVWFSLLIFGVPGMWWALRALSSL